MIAANSFDASGWTAPVAPEGRTPQEIVGTDADLMEVAKLLDRLPPEHCDNYNQWFGVLASLHNTDPALKELARSWSKRSSRYSPGEFDRVWESIANSNYNGPRRTLATLRHIVNGTSEERPPFEVFTLGHLLEGDFRVTYLIDGILAAGQPCIFAGPQKVCKTMMLLWMALCLSMGRPFLGRACKKSRVLFMSGESGLPTLQEAAQRMIAALGGDYDPDSFHLSPDLPMLSRPLDELENLLGDLKIDVLIIDPAYLCMEGTEAGNMFVMGQQLRSLAQLCTRLGITPVIAHHTTKSASREHKPLELTDIAWSGFGEFARQWVLLSRRESYVDGTGEHKLFMRAGGSAGHSQLLHLDISEGVFPNRHWQIESKTAGQVVATAAESQHREDCQRVLDVLREAGEPLCKTPIRDRSGTKPRFTELFRRMLADGMVVEAGKSRGNPTYFTPEETNER